MIKWLNDQGVKAVTIIDPGVKYEPGGTYSVFNEARCTITSSNKQTVNHMSERSGLENQSLSITPCLMQRSGGATNTKPCWMQGSQASGTT